MRWASEDAGEVTGDAVCWGTGTETSFAAMGKAWGEVSQLAELLLRCHRRRQRN